MQWTGSASGYGRRRRTRLQTTLQFTLERAQEIELSVIDLMGRKVQTLMEGLCSGGGHFVIWQGRDDHGRSVSSGLYLATLRTEQGVFNQRMMLVR